MSVISIVIENSKEASNVLYQHVISTRSGNITDEHPLPTNLQNGVKVKIS